MSSRSGATTWATTPRSPWLPPAVRGTLARMSTLKGKTLFITGASRGIGKAIALRAARDGANMAIAAKTELCTWAAGPAR